MGDINVFLPDIKIPQDNLWINDNIFDKFPPTADVSVHASLMAAINGEFQKLCSRKQSTSTPFWPRTLSTSTPATTLNDSGFIENSMLVNFSGKCSISNNSPIVSDGLMRMRQDSESCMESDAELCISTLEPSLPKSDFLNSLDSRIDVSKCHETDTDSAFGDGSQGMSFSDCASMLSEHKSETGSEFSDGSHSQSFSDCASFTPEHKPETDSAFRDRPQRYSVLDCASVISDLCSESDSQYMDTGIDLSLPHARSTPPSVLQMPHFSFGRLNSSLSLSSAVILPLSFSEDLDRVLKDFSPSVPNRLIGRKVGLSKLDIIQEMSIGNKDCLPLVLSFLEPKDLCQMCLVSKVWKKVIDDDSSAFRRKHEYLASFQTIVSQKVLSTINILKLSLLKIQ